MSWRVALTGLSTTLQLLDDIEVTFGTNAAYVVGSDVEYAVYQEFGTSKMEAQPYLRPAARDAQRNIDALAAQADDADELVKVVALYIERRAKTRAPVDTGRLRASITAEKIS